MRLHQLKNRAGADSLWENKTGGYGWDMGLEFRHM